MFRALSISARPRTRGSPSSRSNAPSRTIADRVTRALFGPNAAAAIRVVSMSEGSYRALRGLGEGRRDNRVEGCRIGQRWCKERQMGSDRLKDGWGHPEYGTELIECLERRMAVRNRAPHSAAGTQMRNRPTRRSRSRDALSGSLPVARSGAPRSTGKSRVRNDPPSVVVEPGKRSVVADRQLARASASTGLCCSLCGSD